MEKAGVMLTVRVTPRAARDEVVGWQGDVLRLRLRAPPLEGRANEALRRLLAAALDVSPSQVTLVAGSAARTKRLWIEGVSAEQVASRLGSG